MSTHRRIYLDFNATAPVLPSVTAAMTAALTEVGNPSSIHAEGRAARDRIERARNRVAALLGRPREQVVFTSGGTEANLVGVRALAHAETRIAWTTPLEHPSLHGALASLGWDVRRFAVDAGGRVQLPPVSPAGLVAVGQVNHELGTVQDLDAIAAWAREAGARLHVDAVQAAGKRPLGIGDAIAISAHKLGGPMGIGAVALAVEGGAEGGHQERGRRPGTENVAGIVGFGVAVDEVSAWAPVAALGERLEAGLVALGARIHGSQRVGGTINAAWDGARGESIVIALDLAGVAVSTGAACTSGSVQPSPVLLGLGLAPERAREAVRFSLGRSTTAGEIDQVLALLPPIVERARRF